MPRGLRSSNCSVVLFVAILLPTFIVPGTAPPSTEEAALNARPRLTSQDAARTGTDLKAFWNEQRKGANFFNQVPAEERFRAASELGLDFIRLVPDKWKSSNRDFLLGSADHYDGLPEEDLARLVGALDAAARTGNKVVLGMLSLPGARWVQLNEGKQDYRLWNTEDFQDQACRFWKDLARRLRGHPAIVAYNPLNEPHPEREAGLDGAEEPGFEEWLASKSGNASDLDRFYLKIVSAIREVDPVTPILVEGYGHGSAAGLTYLTPVSDERVLYSFHFYEPWIYTATRVNRGRYAYPDRMPQYWDGPTERWSKSDLRERIVPVERWAEKHGISRSRIVAAEFGCGRKSEGVIEYLTDLVSLLNEGGYHWAFYSYREDTWDSMDYELGIEVDRAGGYPLLEQGKYRIKNWHDNPLFDVLKREFKP